MKISQRLLKAVNKICLVIILSQLCVFNALAALPISVDEVPIPSLAPMLDRVQASVVTVTAEAVVTTRYDQFDDPFFRRFFDQRRLPARQQTTKLVGVIVGVGDNEAYVLTNERFLRGASNVNVTLHTGEVFKAVLVGLDTTFDLALLKIKASYLTAIELGDSSKLRVGDFVVSIGDPLGEQNTIVSGIVSSPAKLDSLKQYQHFIHSDAAVGSGILVDLHGRLIGVNIAQSSQTESNARIGFSTPVNMAIKIKHQLIKYGTPQRGFLSVQIQDLTQQLASAFDLQQTDGVVITNVIAGSSAALAGLQVGDVVLQAGKHTIKSRKDLMTIIGQRFAGESLNLTVMQKGQQKNINVELESSTKASKSGTLIHPHLEGATLNNLDAVKLNLDESIKGVLVSQVKKGSVAWKHGLRDNDVITSVNRQKVTNLDTFRKAISSQEVLMLNIVRGSGAMFLLLQ